jgi:hypothetical protein
MVFKRGNKWALTSKADGFTRAKKFHVCLDCRHNQNETFKECPACGSKNRQYFMSRAELKRGMLLLTLQAAGTISRLRFQPRYDLIVNGQKIGVYTADAEYYQDGIFVVEDTKPANFMDETAKIKIKLFEAIYGLTVKIPQRKSGNRSAPGSGKTLL